MLFYKLFPNINSFWCFRHIRRLVQYRSDNGATVLAIVAFYVYITVNSSVLLQGIVNVVMPIWIRIRLSILMQISIRIWIRILSQVYAY